MLSLCEIRYQEVVFVSITYASRSVVRKYKGELMPLGATQEPSEDKCLQGSSEHVKWTVSKAECEGQCGNQEPKQPRALSVKC